MKQGVQADYFVNSEPADLQAVHDIRAVLDRRGLIALLVFAQESHYYLAGYDSADEHPTVLLTRRPAQRQADVASVYDDIRI